MSSPKIHHLNCGSMHPFGARLINGRGGFTSPAELSCHCLLIETSEGLVLVDTGFGTEDIEMPGRLGFFFRRMARPRLRMEDTALAQIKKRGYSNLDCPGIRC